LLLSLLAEKPKCKTGPKELLLRELISSCCGKQKPTMSPLRKQGTRAKKLDSRWSLSRTRCGAGMTNMDTYASNRRTVSATVTK